MSARLSVPGDHDTFAFRAAIAPSHGTAPSIAWAAPTSKPIDEVESAWASEGSLRAFVGRTGPWAVVAWDTTRREYLLVVDPLGVHPLYWTRTTSGEFIVSPWLHALLEQPGVDSSIDYEGVLLDETAGLYGEERLHRTRFASVSKVPWGRALRVQSDGSTRLERYWDPRSISPPDQPLTLDDAADMLRERIDAAVRTLTPDADIVGGHVSGGLDCTTVTCRANQLLNESGRSLVAGYSWAPSDDDVPRFDGDERALLDEVSASEGFPIRTVHADGSGDWYFDCDHDRYPQAAHVRERFVLPAARADGVKVMLSGWGGDEFASFNGRGALRHLVRRGHLATVWEQTSKRARILSEAAGLRQQTRSFGATVLDAAPPWFPDPRHRADRRREAANEAEIDRILRPVSPLAADLRRARIDAFARATDHREVQLELLAGGHLQRRCDSWYQTGRLFDITYHYPLLDFGVVAAALQLPWHAFYSQGWTRTAFRMAVEPWVPAAVAWNVSKSEPTLFGPQGITRVAQPTNRPIWRADDPEYQRIIELAARVNALGRGSARTPRSLQARPGEAPTLP